MVGSGLIATTARVLDREKQDEHILEVFSIYTLVPLNDYCSMIADLQLAQNLITQC